MRKVFFLFLFGAGFTTVIAQPVYTQVDSVKRPYFYYLKIQTLDGEKTKAVLSRFSDDSVFIVPFENKFVFMAGTFKITGHDEEKGIAAEKIKSLFIRKDKTIVDRDTLEKYKSGIVGKNILLGALSFGVDAAVSSLPIGGTGGLSGISALNTTAMAMVGAAVVTGTLVLASGGKKFTLDGNKEKFNEMIQELTGLKKPDSKNIQPMPDQ